jgi:PAS domain S-box-containing protein
VRGASVTEWIAATDRELFNGLLRNVLATGGPRYVELEWEPAGREPGRVALAAQTIRLGDEPRVAIFCFDLRVQKYVFETFQTAEARYRAIVEARPQLVCRLLPDTTLTFANEAFCRFFRTTRDEAIGRSLLEFLPSKARRSAQNAINRAVRETQPRSCEHAATGPDAHRHWLDWIYLPVWLPDGSLELHVIGQDATRQHAEQAALRASRRKVADLSSRLINDDELAHRRIARELHDGFSQQIAAHAFALARLERDFGGANAELQHRIGQLQRDIIVIGDSIRLFSHRLHPSVVEHLGLPAAFRALCRDVEDQSGIRIALEVTEPWPKLSIETNYSLYRIGQEILTNLVRHARATDAKIQLHAREHGIVLSFEDNGIGFEREKVQDGPTLGLVSLEERVSFLRGKLVIESAPSRGTHVRIDLPVTSSC